MMDTYNYPISIIRNLALVIVLVLHLRQSCEYTISGIPWECGVPLFLIISGFLFGQGWVDNTFQWYKKRILRIWIPFMLLFTINLSVFLIHGSKMNLSCILQGVFALPAFNFNTIGMQHCWYIRYLLICYLLVPLLHKTCAKHTSTWGVIIKISIIYFVVIALCQFSANIPFIGKYSFVQILLFMTAFYIGKIVMVKNTRIAFVTSVFIGTIVAAISYTVPFFIPSLKLKGFLSILYYAYLSLVFFGIIMSILERVFRNILIDEKLTGVIKKFDHNTYYIYLCHYWFTSMSWWSVWGEGMNILSVIKYFFLILFTTIPFCFISESINGWIKKNIWINKL